MKQRTLKRAVEAIGIGLHKGVPVKLRLEPMAEDSGIVFYRSLPEGVFIETNLIISVGWSFCRQFLHFLI
jgi:UDP-3-O-[3-hydroxymyristoyl] N-acetylglucosamine deacetylase